MAKPLLSIGMIFKNDIRSLERSLRALEPLRKAIPCELVMADTGSTDGSRAVAEQYADLLIDFPWVNDFSAARNAVMDRCSGVWYFTVDSDEYLDPNISELTDFLNARKWDVTYAYIVQRNYRTLEMRKGEYSDFLAQRLVRMSSGVRYEGAIHESWPPLEQSKSFLMRHIVVHHDGYATNRKAEQREKKERNLTLLRAEFEKDPNDPRRLLQCIESSGFHPEEHMGYLYRAMDLLMQEKLEAFPRTVYGPPLYCHAVCKALDEKLPQAESWLAWGESNLPQAILFRIDVAATAVRYFYQKNEYKTALIWEMRYEQGYVDFKAGKINPIEMTAGAVRCATDSNWKLQRLLHAGCLLKLDRQEEGIRILEGLELEQLCQEPLLILRGLGLLFQIKGEEKRAQIMCARMLAGLQERRQHVKDEVGKNQRDNSVEDMYHACVSLVTQAFQDKNEGWWLFRQAPGDLGCAARAMDLLEPLDLASALRKIEDWSDIPSAVVFHAIEYAAPLPDRFYYQGEEHLRMLIASIGKERALPLAILRWSKCDDFGTSLTKFQFLFQLISAALRNGNWKKGENMDELCALFERVSAAYLPALYNPELLADESDWAALPGLHRFACYLTRAYACWEQGDELGYVRALRAGLDAAPAMKGMVDFLLEHKPETAAKRQLEELAGQVRDILAHYAPDDPMVMALKQSEAYQKVAVLLDKKEPTMPQPQVAEEMVSPALLEEALTGSREEMEASIRQNTERWGAVHAKARADYWEKYPLWGKNAGEVVDNLSAALYKHRADFRWLFDRLADEQSRQVLTAVVRSWRFYEVEALGRVKEKRYDDYFDLSLFHCNENEVVADLGAYVGDTFLSYVKNYGSMAYRRYYCYEITPDSFSRLQVTTAPYPRVVLRRKGAGDGPGTMTLDTGSDASANTLTDGGDTSTEMVEIVALDDDIAEPLTLIKMDIEGAEQSALVGCARHIQEDRPKLALSVYHNFEDIWKLPRMIEELVPGYRFYLRYHGGDLWPSEITLLALPPQA